MPQPLDLPIHTIRGQKVVMDANLASIYGVATKALNQAVRRNADRFPEDFAFKLTKEEFDSLRSQIVTLEKNRREIQPLLEPPAAPEKPEIGFHVREDAPPYPAIPTIRRTKS